MDAPVTFRLSAIAVSTDDTKTTIADRQQPAETESADEDLLAQISKGSRDALSVLFQRYARLVHTVANRVLHAPGEADDLVQDVFLLIYRDCGSFDRSKGAAKSWILQMAYRRAISRRRYLTSRHFYTRLDLDEVASQFADASAKPGKLEESIDEQCGKGSLQRVFAALSENQRETLRLFFAEGYTFDEIAAKLGQSRGNIKRHYFRALDRLRKALFAGKWPGDRAREEFLSDLGAGRCR
jgi:RNA polymerase sigma-70 factor (ECF subfamily)